MNDKINLVYWFKNKIIPRSYFFCNWFETLEQISVIIFFVCFMLQVVLNYRLSNPTEVLSN